MLHVRDLAKSFPQGRAVVEAVRGVSFSVAGGEVYGLLGPNGAGKTTTLRMILGLLEPDAGRVAVGEAEPNADAGRKENARPSSGDLRRQLGLISASAGLYQWLTPREVLAFFATIYGVPPDVARRRCEQLIDTFGIGGFADRRCGVLSTGQSQRVNLARALVHDPPVVLLDEPTRGLDVVGSQAVFDYVDHLRGQSRAVVVCTHRLDEAQRLCDRFGLLFDGRIVEEGTLAELQARTGREALVDMFGDLIDRGAAA